MSENILGQVQKKSEQLKGIMSIIKDELKPIDVTKLFEAFSKELPLQIIKEHDTEQKS